MRPFVMNIEEYTRKRSEEELKKEYIRIKAKLVKDSSAVKNKSDLELNVCLSFIKHALEDLHGVPHGELIKLDNPNYAIDR